MSSETQSKMRDDFNQFVGSAKKAAGELGQELSRTAERLIDEARSLRKQLVVSVRLDDESARRVDQLIDTGVCRTRSEAVAFLTREGITHRQDLFEKIDAKIDAIHRIQEEIRQEAYQSPTDDTQGDDQ